MKNQFSAVLLALLIATGSAVAEVETAKMGLAGALSPAPIPAVTQEMFFKQVAG